jgi:6-pyruvoyltetrahydropterin/6-carboxytetrahydropterin synthase
MTSVFELQRTFRFEAAHYLPHAPADHRCRRLHGHSYGVEIHVRGTLDESRGWVVDFGEIDDMCEPVRQQLDHQLLNEVPGLSNPTAENLARWIWEQLLGAIPGLCAIVVRETARSACVYRG